MSLCLKMPPHALSPLIAEAQDQCEDLYVLVGVSPKRVLLFRNIQAEIGDVSDTLRLKTYLEQDRQPEDQQLRYSLRKP